VSGAAATCSKNVSLVQKQTFAKQTIREAGLQAAEPTVFVDKPILYPSDLKLWAADFLVPGNKMLCRY
jgi:hypothetical protein